MTVFDRIKELSEKRGISVQKAAIDIGFSENLFYQWKTSSPKSDRLQKVGLLTEKEAIEQADLFDVEI